MVAYYDFDTIKKYILVFCKLFSDIHVMRYNSDNTLLKDIKVPIIYASKNKAYYELNANLESVATKLPLISINMVDMTYDIQRQKNSMYGHNFISKVDNRIKKFVEHPAPYTFAFELTIWTKKTSDMHKLLQQILPIFKPYIVKNVNILPEMNLSDETKITYQGLRDESQLEFTESPDSSKMVIKTLSFDLNGLLFDPIKDKKIAKTIELYIEGTKRSVADQYSYDDIINNKLISLTDYDEEIVKTFEVTVTEEKELYNYFIDLSSEIAQYGEGLKIVDLNENEYPFVFEYSNGEYYGYDNMIPDGLVLTKTGNICMLIPEMDPGTRVFNVINQVHSNYEFANDVINLYVDFNRSVLRDVTIENKTKNDIIYNKNSNLIVKTINGDCKVFTNNSIDSDDSIFEMGFSSLDFENDKFICGLHTENGDNYIYLKTNDTTQTIEIHEVVDGTDSLLSSVSSLASISKIEFEFIAGDLTIDVDGQSYTFTPSINLIIPFVNWNGTNAAYLDYILGYRK